jgi:hypothetical protein
MNFGKGWAAVGLSVCVPVVGDPLEGVPEINEALDPAPLGGAQRGLQGKRIGMSVGDDSRIAHHDRLSRGARGAVMRCR